jgi:hypothetical protein
MLRRRFIQRLGTALSTAAFWKIALPSSAVASISKQTLRDYPRPLYVPDGFVEVTAISGLRRSVDGFGDKESEIALWYRNDKHPLGFNNPLSIFITPNPQRGFAGSGDVEPSLVPISLRSGSTVLAEYHDGMTWVLPNGKVGWHRTNVHSLVFELGNYSIGIRGARVVGIDSDELIAIASSF